MCISYTKKNDYFQNSQVTVKSDEIVYSYVYQDLEYYANEKAASRLD